MRSTGFVIHHSSCTSINGKGYDFFVTRQAVIIPAAEPAEPGGPLHICLEGDFSRRFAEGDADVEEQLFVTAKLIARLADACGIPAGSLHAHDDGCPGERFPWAKLVLSISDGYH